MGTKKHSVCLTGLRTSAKHRYYVVMYPQAEILRSPVCKGIELLLSFTAFCGLVYRIWQRTKDQRTQQLKNVHVSLLLSWYILCKDVNHELTARTRSWWVFNRCGVVVAKTVYIIHTWMIGGGCFTHIPVGVSLPSDHERRSLTHSTHLLLNLHTPHPGIGMYHRYAQRSFAR